MIKPITELLSQTVDSIEKRYQNQGKFTGIATGYKTLDAHTDGFQKGELVILGARPSVGKTAFALNMIMNMLYDKVSVGMFSIEMPAWLLLYRLISLTKLIDSTSLRTGKLEGNDMEMVIAAANYLSATQLWLCDEPSLYINNLEKIAEEMVKNYAIKILFVDYITLIRPQTKGIPRHEQVSDISQRLKGLARKLEIPVVAVSQVKREVEGRYPNLSDLRESGSLEQDADVVLLLHRDRDKEEFLKNSAKLWIAKNRNGPIGMVKMDFLPQYMKFSEEL